VEAKIAGLIFPLSSSTKTGRKPRARRALIRRKNGVKKGGILEPRPFKKRC
jgi:hypothetical protein